MYCIVLISSAVCLLSKSFSKAIFARTMSHIIRLRGVFSGFFKFPARVLLRRRVATLDRYAAKVTTPQSRVECLTLTYSQVISDMYVMTTALSPDTASREQACS